MAKKNLKDEVIASFEENCNSRQEVFGMLNDDEFVGFITASIIRNALSWQKESPSEVLRLVRNLMRNKKL